MEGHTFPEFRPNTVDWYLPREARRDLQIVWLQRTNLLLLGTSGPTRMVLEMLKLDLREPVMTWRPGQPLDLPPPGRAATLILHDVDELTSPDQHAVLRWLEQNAGQTRVVSTTAEPLWPRVRTGSFDEVLYYRLNTVCLSATGAES